MIYTLLVSLAFCYYLFQPTDIMSNYRTYIFVTVCRFVLLYAKLDIFYYLNIYDFGITIWPCSQNTCTFEFQGIFGVNFVHWQFLSYPPLN